MVITMKTPISPRRSASRPAGFIVRVLLVGLAMMVASPAPAQVDDPYKKAGDVAVYLGVLSAQIVRGHPAGHPERTMHGGAPSGEHEYHVVTAVFDATSGDRVSDAAVAMTVSGLGHVGGTRRTLAPMTMAGVVTYGAFVSLPGSDRYEIVVEIKRSGRNAPEKVQFTYLHSVR